MLHTKILQTVYKKIAIMTIQEPFLGSEPQLHYLLKKVQQ